MGHTLDNFHETCEALGWMNNLSGRWLAYRMSLAAVDGTSSDGAVICLPAAVLRGGYCSEA